jgi:hypothetical protein
MAGAIVDLAFPAWRPFVQDSFPAFHEKPLRLPFCSFTIARNDLIGFQWRRIHMDQSGMMNEPPKKGGGWLKWTLIGCGGLLGIGALIAAIGGYLLYKNTTMTTEPEKAEAVAQEILQFEKPAGYHGAMALSTLGMKTALLTAPGTDNPEQGGIMLMTIPVAMSTEQAEQQLRAQMDRRGGAGRIAQDRRPSENFTVRGETLPAQVGASGSDTPKTIHYTLVLKGAANTTALLLISGPEDEITHDWVQEFLKTVK